MAFGMLLQSLFHIMFIHQVPHYVYTSSYLPILESIKMNNLAFVHQKSFRLYHFYIFKYYITANPSIQILENNCFMKI